MLYRTQDIHITAWNSSTAPASFDLHIIFRTNLLRCICYLLVYHLRFVISLVDLSMEELDFVPLSSGSRPALSFRDSPSPNHLLGSPIRSYCEELDPLIEGGALPGYRRDDVHVDHGSVISLQAHSNLRRSCAILQSQSYSPRHPTKVEFDPLSRNEGGTSPSTSVSVYPECPDKGILSSLFVGASHQVGTVPSLRFDGEWRQHLSYPFLYHWMETQGYKSTKEAYPTPTNSFLSVPKWTEDSQRITSLLLSCSRQMNSQKISACISDIKKSDSQLQKLQEHLVEAMGPFYTVTNSLKGDDVTDLSGLVGC